MVAIELRGLAETYSCAARAVDVLDRIIADPGCLAQLGSSPEPVTA